MKPWINIGGDTGLCLSIGWFYGEACSVLEAELLTITKEYTIFFHIKVLKFVISFAYFK